jgi:hypothetical protein
MSDTGPQLHADHSLKASAKSCFTLDFSQYSDKLVPKQDHFYNTIPLLKFCMPSHPMEWGFENPENLPEVNFNMKQLCT